MEAERVAIEGLCCAEIVHWDESHKGLITKHRPIVPIGEACSSHVPVSRVDNAADPVIRGTLR